MILFVNACVRPSSRTYQLTNYILNKMKDNIEEINLENEKIQPLDWITLQNRDIYINTGDYSSPIFKYAKQFAKANIIVIAAPYWDLSFPAMLKCYFEAITVLGVTFKYTQEGKPIGLCKAKKLIYVTTAGGMIQENDFGFEYVKMLAQKFYGIENIECYRCENLDIAGSNVEDIMENEKRNIDNKLF